MARNQWDNLKLNKERIVSHAGADNYAAAVDNNQTGILAIQNLDIWMNQCRNLKQCDWDV